jgi:hypothetical protein
MVEVDDITMRQVETDKLSSQSLVEQRSTECDGNVRYGGGEGRQSRVLTSLNTVLTSLDENDKGIGEIE